MHRCSLRSSRSDWHSELSPFDRPSMDNLGIIIRGCSQLSNGMAHNEEMFELLLRKNHSLGSTSTYLSTEIAPVRTF
ncbi:hypothetical protein TNCT_403101 [Trichonephila clavata]|uniref:Uncharacterized protein n=1 Tax=Trichonephila clavata TaxID=2740835 RepID=A0A8X6LH72_TRICU|nr:hypothetical protein TNCT_403101 [Trichonephila clavata]